MFNEKGLSLGVVGQAGQILLRGVEQGGRLTARWQDDKGTQQSCAFDYRLGPENKHKQTAKQYEQLTTVCAVPVAAAYH